MVLRSLDQRADVLRQARAAEARAGVQELRPDSIVEPDAARDFLHIRTDALAKIGYFVDEGDLGGQECVRGVLDELRCPAAGVEDRSLIQIQWAVDLGRDPPGTLILGADDDAIRMLEIVDRGAFAQEFRIRHDGKVRIVPELSNDALNLVAGADRHSRFGDNDGEPLERLGDFARRPVNVGQIGMSVSATRWSADRDEHGVGATHRLSQRGGKRQPPLLDVRADDIAEPRLEDWNFACIESRNLGAILIDAGDLMAEIRDTSARNEAHVISADHRNPHVYHSHTSHNFKPAAIASLQFPIGGIKHKCYARNNVMSM